MSLPSDWLRWWDWVLALMIAASMVLWFSMPGFTDSTTEPILAHAIRSEVDLRGMAHARVDMEMLRSEFRQAGLPDPPDVNGSDPVPVTVLLERLSQWRRHGDPQVLGEMGQVFLALEQPEASLDFFVVAAELDPGQAQWRYFVGVQCQALGRSEQAINALRAAQAAETNYPTTSARLGLLYLEANGLNEAQGCYEQYCALRPQESLGYVGLGRVALARGMPEAAVKWLTTAVNNSPSDFLAHRLLSQALAQVGRTDEARAESALSDHLPKYRGWLTFDPRLAESHRLANTQRYLENEIRWAMGAQEHQRAMASAEALAERRPGDADMLATWAATLHRAGQLDKAQQVIQRAIELDPAAAAPLRVRAEMAFARKDYDAARQLVEALLALDPDSARGHEIRGRLNVLQNQSEQALADLRRSVELDPVSPDALRALIVVLKQAGLADEALQTVRNLLRLQPSDPWARQQWQALRAATQPAS